MRKGFVVLKFISQHKTLIKILGIVAFWAVAFSAGMWTNERLKSPEERLVSLAYRVIARDSLFNDKSNLEISYAAIRGMIASIHDPYAELIEPAAAQHFSNTFSGQTGVIGLYAENKSNQVVISIVFPNGSADQAGLQVGDVLLAIDGVNLDQDSDSSEAGLMMRGSPGSTVHLKVERDNQILEFDLNRQLREYVSFQILPERVGYVALTAFNQTATEQMKTALEGLLTQNPVGLIWDLRNNEGGDMQAAQNILSYFIKDGLLFSAEMTHGRTYQFYASGKPIATEIPLLVLMDETTYSAAETCAAAIAETGRGKTVGSTSYGKGVVQATVPLLDGTMLQMTVAKWRSPHGEWYHERGVLPQIDASDNPGTKIDELLQTAVQLLIKE